MRFFPFFRSWLSWGLLTFSFAILCPSVYLALLCSLLDIITLFANFATPHMPGNRAT